MGYEYRRFGEATLIIVVAQPFGEYGALRQRPSTASCPAGLANTNRMPISPPWRERSSSKLNNCYMYGVKLKRMTRSVFAPSREQWWDRDAVLSQLDC